MKNTAVFKIILLVLALCLVAGSVFGVYKSLSSGNMQSQTSTEALAKLSTELLITGLMQSDFLNYYYWADSQEAFERYLRSDPLLTEILQRPDGPTALMEYHDQHKDENFKETIALESLFFSATFLKAYNPEAYDRLFPE